MPYFEEEDKLANMMVAQEIARRKAMRDRMKPFSMGDELSNQYEPGYEQFEDVPGYPPLRPDERYSQASYNQQQPVITENDLGRYTDVGQRGSNRVGGYMEADIPQEDPMQAIKNEIAYYSKWGETDKVKALAASLKDMAEMERLIKGDPTKSDLVEQTIYDVKTGKPIIINRKKNEPYMPPEGFALQGDFELKDAEDARKREAERSVRVPASELGKWRNPENFAPYPSGTTRGQLDDDGAIQVSPKQVSDYKAVQSAYAVVDGLRDLIDKIVTPDSHGTWGSSMTSGANLKLGAMLKTIPEAQQYQDLKAGSLAKVLKGGFGEVGVLTDSDIERVVKMLPDFTDQYSTVQVKLNFIYRVIAASERASKEVILGNLDSKDANRMIRREIEDGLTETTPRPSGISDEELLEDARQSIESNPNNKDQILNQLRKWGVRFE